MKVSIKKSKFLWLGNNPVLDFVNTDIIHQGARVDLLAVPADLIRWLLESGIAQGRDFTACAKRLSQPDLEMALQFARNYRNAVRMALPLLSRRSTDSLACDETNHLLATARSTYSLTVVSGEYELKHHWPFKSPEDMIRPLAFAFANLVTNQDLTRIRKCHNPECVLFFLDTSRNGARAWCSVNICGNKLRAAAFRKRHKQS